MRIAPLACSWAPRAPFDAPMRFSASSGAEMSTFFAFLGVFFNVKCLGTWEENSSLCKVFKGVGYLYVDFTFI